MIFLDLPPQLVLPRPAIIRPATPELIRKLTPQHIADMLRPPALREVSEALAINSKRHRNMRPRAVVVTYIGGTANTSGLTTYTFTDHAIGGPGLIVVGVSHESSTSDISSATIGGLSARIVAQAGGGGVATGAAILSARITSGTTATIVVNFADAPVRCQVNVWRLQHVRSDTEHAVDTDAVTATTISTNVDVLQDGAAIGVMTGNDGTVAVTWAGVTENYDGNIGGGNTRASGGSLATTATESGRVISATGTSNDRTLATASWR
jgi:hypothetical protein